MTLSYAASTGLWYVVSVYTIMFIVHSQLRVLVSDTPIPSWAGWAVRLVNHRHNHALKLSGRKVSSLPSTAVRCNRPLWRRALGPQLENLRHLANDE